VSNRPTAPADHNSRRQLVRRSIILTSFILFPITIFYFSPALIVMGAAAGIVAGSALVFAAQFVSALFLGRGFCGWVCPAAGEQEACFIAQSKRVNGRKCDWIKYLIWVPWIGGIAYLFARNGVRSVDPFFMMESPISLSSPALYPVYLIVTGLILVLALSVGRRGFCHAACWMAPFMILGTRVQRLIRIPALRLRAASDRCIECSSCTRACPMSLDVTDMVRRGDMFSSECVLCGSCADACAQQAIRLAFGVSPHSSSDYPPMQQRVGEKCRLGASCR
jgi:ferredoxin-type protein NapH